jgi:hypothetical protein
MSNKLNLLVLLPFLGIFLFFSFRPGTAEDEAAIKEVIASETKAFFALDYNGWASHWLQSAHDHQAWNNRDGGVFSSSGWEKVGAGAKAYIDAQKAPLQAPTITRDNWDFHINGDMAAVYFVQHYSSTNGSTDSHEHRIMVRKGGQWKISGMQAFWDYKNAK